MQILEPSLRVAARGRFARENDGQTRYAAWGLRSTAVAGVSSITVFFSVSFAVTNIRYPVCTSHPWVTVNLAA